MGVSCVWCSVFGPYFVKLCLSCYGVVGDGPISGFCSIPGVLCLVLS